MKRIFTLLLAFIIVFCFTSCSKQDEFKATVVEVSENTISVKPFDNEEEAKSSDIIIINLNNKLNLSENKPQKGDKVIITYGGEIAESYPAQILDCSKIKIMD